MTLSSMQTVPIPVTKSSAGGIFISSRAVRYRWILSVLISPILIRSASAAISDAQLSKRFTRTTAQAISGLSSYVSMSFSYTHDNLLHPIRQ